MKMEYSPRSSSFGRHELVVEYKAKKTIRNKLCFAILLLLANLSLLLFLRSPFFTITEISVQGLDKLSSTEIRLVMGLREGMNIWKVSPLTLRERILTLPRVAETEVGRALPGKLLIHVQEKHALALVPYQGNYLELARDGTLIGIRNSYAGELPLVNGLPRGQMGIGSKIMGQDLDEIMEVFLTALAENPPPPLAEINVENLEKLVIYTWEGTEVWLGDKKDLPKKIEVLKRIHAHFFPLQANADGGYLDLRVVESPVLRPF